MIPVKIKYWASKLWILRKLGIVYDPDERGNRLESMVDRMADKLVDKDAEIYTLKQRIAELEAMITRNA
jgi:hypothetical protein